MSVSTQFFVGDIVVADAMVESGRVTVVDYDSTGEARYRVEFSVDETSFVGLGGLYAHELQLVSRDLPADRSPEAVERWLAS